MTASPADPTTGALAPKVPALGAASSTDQVVTTEIGEAAVHYLAEAKLPSPALSVFSLTVVMWLQFRSWRYVARTYQVAVAMVAVLVIARRDVPGQGR